MKTRSKKTSLTPIFADGTVYFKEAKLVLICEKVYQSQIKKEGILDPQIIEDYYATEECHYQYIGKILKVLTK